MTAERLGTIEVRELARFAIRERDAALRTQAAYPDLPTLAARYEGQANAYDTILAYLSGHVGLRSGEALEALAAARPVPVVEVDPTWTEAELRQAWGDR